MTVEPGSTVWWVGKFWCVDRVNCAEDGWICSLDVSREDKQGEEETACIQLRDFELAEDA